MEKSLVPMFANDLFITHAECQGCFIKIWANTYSKKRSNMENIIQNYINFTKELSKLDLYGNTMYVYIWNEDCDTRVYRCQVVSSDLVAKTHTVILIDYGKKMIVPYMSVREIVKEIDQSILIGLSQTSTLKTFLLSEFICKPKLNKKLITILCNKYYKYRRDFEVGGITFISLCDVNQKMIDNGLADKVDISTMINIANTLSSSISLNNINDYTNIPNSSKAPTLCPFPRSQQLDYVTLLDVIVTRILIENNSILLTVQTLDNETEALDDILNSISRQNLKLAPILEVYTPCLIIFREKLVRAIILDVTVDRLYIDLIDYGIREFVPRTVVFEIPSNCNTIEMRSLNVIIDKPNDSPIEKTMFVQKYFQMLPIKMDPNFGLYKVKLFKKENEELVNVSDILKHFEISPCKKYSVLSKSPEMFSITEISDEIKILENTTVDDCAASPLIHLYNNQTEKENKVINEDIIVTKEQKDPEAITEDKSMSYLTPIVFLKKDDLKDNQELVGSLIYYKSPFNFYIRQFNINFKPFMDQVKANISSRYVLTKCELVKNMYVIYQNQSSCIYRAQVIDIYLNTDEIKLELIDEGEKLIIENFNNIVLYNFQNSDCDLPRQMVLKCSLNDMWFPVLNIDLTLILQPFFKKEFLYIVRIIKTDKSGIRLVNIIEKDTNIDISDKILQSGIGQRLHAAVKTGESPYEENLLVGQSFLSYIYNYHLKLFIQPEPNTVNELEKEIADYIETYSISEILDVNNLQGTYCLATVNNDQWYRAKIKNINEESIIVYMFDIGLLTEVSLKQIRPITSNLMRKSQLCIFCSLETKDFDIKVIEKKLYNVTVKYIDTNGVLCVSIKEHHTAPLCNPIVRGIEEISFVYVNGDVTYLQRSQDRMIVEKLSKTLSELNGKLENKSSIIPGDIYMFESCGKYYRCLVKSVDSEVVIVHCIDFGFEKRVNKKKIQNLNHSYIALLPALVITVKTFPMANNLCNITFLANMFLDDNRVFNVLPYEPKPILSHKILTDTLENGCLVKVTNVTPNNDCWIVPHLFFENLKTISDTLLEMQSKVIPTVTEVGSLCAALHSKTKKWHRALILNENGETENMLSIDSGEQFRALKSTKLVSEIQKMPNCALHCQVISNVDIKKLLNKDVQCKLISYIQPLLEVELFSNEIDVVNMTFTKSVKEWIVIIYRFESFKEFYIKKIEDVYSNSANEKYQLTFTADELKLFAHQPPVGTLVAALTDKKDNIWYKAEVLAHQNNEISIVRVINDGSICESTQLRVLPENISSEKLYYCCCLEECIDDENMNDPKNVSIIADVMMMSKWLMTTTSDTEPFKVTLTSDGQNCIDIVYGILSTDDNNVSENGDLLKENTKNEINIDSGNTNKNNCNEETINIEDNKLNIPIPEIVSIKCMDTFHYFYASSESLSTLYLPKINSDLDISIIELSLNENMISSIVVTSSQSLNCWCRAKIDKIQPDGVSAHCYLMDYGSYEVCSEFYKPTTFLCICPPLVRRCSLYTPKLTGKENAIWFPNVNEMFRDILSIDGIKFNMFIKENGDPCVVTLQLEDTDVSEMLYPIHIQVSYVNSLTDFKIRAISDDQKTLVKQLENGDIPLIYVKTPKIGNLYLAEIDSKKKRVIFDAFDGTNYIVTDVDDTLEVLTVDSLYQLPDTLSHIPTFSMACSLILNEKEEMYSLNVFKSLASAKVTFIMCIITESDNKTPNFVKLYLDNKDVLDIIRFNSSNK